VSSREYLAALEFHGIKLGLDNINALMAAAGDPHLEIPAIHVAGTNGKGSVVAFINAILRAAGYSVGCFTSPHLIDVTERFLINGEPISNEALDDNIAYFHELTKSLSAPPTYFELCTAIAFRAFAQAKVDASIIEVGMGGRFDSTNIIKPLVTVITNIALDHQKYLGDTLEEIAGEKAGIMKPGVPVVIGERDSEVFDMLAESARVCGAPVICKGNEFTYCVTGTPLEPGITYRGEHIVLNDASLGLAGMHQVENAALAIAAVEQELREFPKVDSSTVEAGLRNAIWPCRLERALDEPPVYIDVAHNPAGIARLVESLPPCVVVFAVSADKDAREMLQLLAPIAQHLILTEFEGDRAMRVVTLHHAAADFPHECTTPLAAAIAEGIKAASTSTPLLITGSIFTAGQARRILVKDYNATPLKFT